jgi:MSHA pilin protein MshD
MQRSGIRENRSQSGISLIELIVFILVVSIAVTGILSVMSSTAAHSADPVVRKQAIAIAEGLLEEVAAQPFSWCDPDDPVWQNPSTTSTAACSIPEAMGREAGESRSAVPLLDNVNDYDGETVSYPDFSATIAVADAGASFGLADNAAALRIEVTVTGKGEQITLSGYRFRHSPNG